MTTNYERGRSHEYAIKRKLEKEGYEVIRASGSHGLFDLVAIENPWFAVARGVIPNIVLIQAKSGKSAERERKKLEPLKAKYEGIYSVRVKLL